MDEKPKRDSGSGGSSNQTAAYILIGLGVLFLLVNLFNFNWGMLWPLILVVIGLYMIFGRNTIGSTVESATFDAPLEGHDAARADIRLSIGESTVNALPRGSEMLVEADLTYIGDIDFYAQDNAVSLRQASGSAIHWLNPATWFSTFDKGGMTWRVSLNPDVPLDLELHAGTGEARIDLRNLNLTGLRYHGGLGEVELSLPSTRYDATIKGGVGELRIDLPQTEARLEINGGVGEITVRTAPGAAVRLTGHGGIGDVHVPSRFVRVAGGDSDFEIGKSGVWQTPDYEQADERVEIDYRGGVGELKII